MKKEALLPTLVIERKCWDEMHTHIVQSASREKTEEVCGLVAGKSAVAMIAIPVTNELHSSTRFRMDPVEQLRAFQWIESQGMELLAIYHSHPQGPAEPSGTDVNETTYPEAVTLIWSPVRGEWHCRGFIIDKGKIQEIQIKLTN